MKAIEEKKEIPPCQKAREESVTPDVRNVVSTGVSTLPRYPTDRERRRGLAVSLSPESPSIKGATPCNSPLRRDKHG
jgi:hypothetical protein